MTPSLPRHHDLNAVPVFSVCVSYPLTSLPTRISAWIGLIPSLLPLHYLFTVHTARLPFRTSTINRASLLLPSSYPMDAIPPLTALTDDNVVDVHRGTPPVDTFGPSASQNFAGPISTLDTTAGLLANSGMTSWTLELLLACRTGRQSSPQYPQLTPPHQPLLILCHTFISSQSHHRSDAAGGNPRITPDYDFSRSTPVATPPRSSTPRGLRHLQSRYQDRRPPHPPCASRPEFRHDPSSDAPFTIEHCPGPRFIDSTKCLCCLQ